MQKLRIVKPSLSLGGIESTICDHATTSHRRFPRGEKTTGVYRKDDAVIGGYRECWRSRRGPFGGVGVKSEYPEITGMEVALTTETAG